MSTAALLTDAESVLSWWMEGFITVADVKRWADVQIASIDPLDLPEWLMTLSLDGPDSELGAAGPQRQRLDFVARLHALVELTSPRDTAAVHQLARWVSCAAMGEDHALPEVSIGYAIDHAFAYGSTEDAIELARQALRTLKPGCTAIAAALPWVTAGG